jgi:hypothetical protein
MLHVLRNITVRMEAAIRKRKNVNRIRNFLKVNSVSMEFVDKLKFNTVNNNVQKGLDVMMDCV